MGLREIVDDYDNTRLTLQRVATHVLARRRWVHTRRFGLRVGADGIATPMFGDDDESLRVVGATLFHERRIDGDARTTAASIHGASLRALGAFADVDLGAAFSAGHDTPDVGDLDAPISLDADAVALITNWYRVGHEALDRTIAARANAAASAVQLWPEHFDLAVDLAAGRSRANLGVSPGDGFSAEPYAYVGPWDAARPGDAAYWNAPFGAVLSYAVARAAADPVQRLAEFFAKGVELLASTSVL